MPLSIYGSLKPDQEYHAQMNRETVLRNLSVSQVVLYVGLDPTPRRSGAKEGRGGGRRACVRAWKSVLSEVRWVR